MELNAFMDSRFSFWRCFAQLENKTYVIVCFEFGYMFLIFHYISCAGNTLGQIAGEKAGIFKVTY